MIGQRNGERERRIVVGVDGSVSSKAALAWAVRQAELTGATVDAVTAWETPAFAPAPWPPELTADYQERARRVVTEAVAEVGDSAGQVTIRAQVAEGNAAEALLQASAGADLLVVGSRGHGGFVEALLGSVGQHCVHHAACPVLVVRNAPADLAGEAATRQRAGASN